jgi:hypothetical protein
LAPDNRYVLRSLTRFWVHQAEPDLALHFLSKFAATRRDPWLLAAQMAAEDVAHKGPSNWREAKRILSAEQFSDFELTELAAAFGTLELQAGSHKLARKMFRRSLTAPTENSVAQVQWASRRDSMINVSHELTAKASEALAWEKLALACGNDRGRRRPRGGLRRRPVDADAGDNCENHRRARELARSTINIGSVSILTDSPAFARVQATMLRALAPFPDARGAVVRRHPRLPR